MPLLGDISRILYGHRWTLQEHRTLHKSHFDIVSLVGLWQNTRLLHVWSSLSIQWGRKIPMSCYCLLKSNFRRCTTIISSTIYSNTNTPPMVRKPRILHTLWVSASNSPRTFWTTANRSYRLWWKSRHPIARIAHQENLHPSSGKLPTAMLLSILATNGWSSTPSSPPASPSHLQPVQSWSVKSIRRG